MIETLLFKNIDEPGLNTIDVYMARGGYKQLEVALKMKRGDLITELSGSGLRGRGGAGFPMGKKASFIPKPAITTLAGHSLSSAFM